MGKHAPPQSNHEARRQHWLDSNHLHFLQCEMPDLLLHMNRILRSMWPRPNCIRVRRRYHTFDSMELIIFDSGHLLTFLFDMPITQKNK